jgi:hypothetical protein
MLPSVCIRVYCIEQDKTGNVVVSKTETCQKRIQILKMDRENSIKKIRIQLTETVANINSND